ncbi:EpsD family peptidyl-prolyl cis-trans isomerase [Massilia sp. Leaf139]|uniref:EpsD family peptidyl-prolyl cis-trans isomerase n=1 Tax=Massilia sp. Leaf139 TaxID=1736272 RepID=UPI0006F4EAC7|nr:EpsD family peptidyl-prolyl cis-trans isomerase [Massilia sp. Leaf139]KQQ88855.1 peptidyl-tRNA hydrolase [Massilia sp. Leaf139]
MLALLTALLAVLSGCGDRAPPAKPGQALANVNGEEITVLQLNEEMQRAGVPAARQQEAGKQLLQALIDRELLEHAAVGEKLDRDPKVMGAIERARSLIVAQAYMQKRLAKIPPPTPAEVEAYYKEHPDYFDKRKQFRMEQLVIAASDLTPELRAAADNARSLEEVAVWLDAQGVKYGRSQVTRSTSDLNAGLAKKLLAMPKGQLFSVREGGRAMLLSLIEVRDAPVPLTVAVPQIAQFLITRKNKELAAAEVERLRQGAKIEYLNKTLAQGPAAPVGTAPARPSPAAAPAAGEGAAGAKAPPSPPAPAASAAPAGGTAQGVPDKAAVDRGVAGLK